MHLPTSSPSESPTHAPTHAPSESPTHAPSESPTHAPTEAPTDAPTSAPTEAPTAAPTAAPTYASIVVNTAFTVASAAQPGVPAVTSAIATATGVDAKFVTDVTVTAAAGPPDPAPGPGPAPGPTPPGPTPPALPTACYGGTACQKLLGDTPVCTTDCKAWYCAANTQTACFDWQIKHKYVNPVNGVVTTPALIAAGKAVCGCGGRRLAQTAEWTVGAKIDVGKGMSSTNVTAAAASVVSGIQSTLKSALAAEGVAIDGNPSHVEVKWEPKKKKKDDDEDETNHTVLWIILGVGGAALLAFTISRAWKANELKKANSGDLASKDGVALTVRQPSIEARPAQATPPANKV